VNGMGCPYIAGPSCRGCDGSCWAPAQTQPMPPDPCYTCSMIVGGTTWCEGLCAGVTNEAEFDAARLAYDAQLDNEGDR
jgi:hypothetical protein